MRGTFMRDRRYVRCFRVLAAAAAAIPAAAAGGAINLELRPPEQTAIVGDVVQIGLYAVSDSGTNQLLAAAQVIISWDPKHLQLLGITSQGAITLLSSSFPANDPFDLNESVPPQDGDGIYVAFAPLGNRAAATPAGALLTTLRFEALATVPATTVTILEEAGSPPGETIVFDGTVRNLDVTGTLTGALVEIVPCCPADFDFDCQVTVTDLLLLLGLWDTDPGGPPDIDGNGNVDVLDLLEVLGTWGPCPEP